MTFTRLVHQGLLEHRGRAAVSAVSVVLGVAVFLGVAASVRAISEELDRAGAISRFEGFVELAPTGVFRATAPVDSADPVRGLPEVVSALGILETPVDLHGAGGHIESRPAQAPSPPDMLAAIPYREGRAPAPGADEIAVGELLANATGLEAGTTVTVGTATGDRRATVTGVIAQPDGSLLAGAGEVTAHPETIQAWAGTDHVLRRVLVQLEPGTDAADWVATNREALGGLQPNPQLFSSDSVDFFREMEASITPLGGVTLVMAGYLIFLTVARTVHDRQPVYGTMRAVGASRGQVVRLVLAEAAVIGVVGTAVGIAVGSWLAQVLARLASDAFGIPVTESARFDPSSARIALAAGIGILTPLLAAALPAFRAARLDPAVAVRGTPVDHPPSGAQAWVGAALLVSGTALTAGTPEGAVLRLVAMVGALAGTALLVPYASRLVGGAVRPLWRRLSPGPGDLAAQRLSRRPGRSAATAGLLATALALVFMIATLSSSGRRPFVDLVHAHFGGDLNLYSTDARGFDRAAIEAVRRRPEVAGVSAVDFGRVELLSPGGRTEWLRVVEPEAYFDSVDFPWVAGSDAARSRRLFAQGGHVLVATNIAERTGLAPGDRARIQSVRGPVELTVAGVFAGLEIGNSRALMVSVADAQRHFGMEEPAELWVTLAPGMTQEKAIAALSGEVFGNEGVGISTNADLRNEILATWESLWGLVYVMLATTAIVAVLGLANTMVMEVLDRRHEVGILRAVGIHRVEVGRLVRMEAITLALTTGVLGVLAGSVIGRAMMAGVELETGVAHPYVFPGAAVPVIVAMAVVVGAAAAALPARRAAALDPAHVLRFS